MARATGDSAVRIVFLAKAPPPQEANPHPWKSRQPPQALPGEGAGVEANERNRSPGGGCDPAAQAVSEYTHNGRTEEDHAHGEGCDPCCREKEHRDTGGYCRV